MKAYKVFDCVINILLAVIYLWFLYIASSMFEIFPWYNGDGGYMISLALIWLPICITTVIQIGVSFIVKCYSKPLVCLAALNAIYIPAIFLLGFTTISMMWVKIICIVAVLTMITYIVLNFRRLKKFKTRNGEKND